MSAAPVVLDLTVEVEPHEARRYLGYPGGRAASKRAGDRLAALWPRAVELLAPRGAWVSVGRRRAAASGMPGPSATVAAAVCTIGPALEAASGRAADAGDLLDALILDAIGSAAAEAAADALNHEICSVAATRGVEASARVSPGYGEWDTAGQRALLALLPIGALGISLTTGGMMVPRKSVSFAVNLGRSAGHHAASACARCGLQRCRHRIASPECG